MGSIKNNNIIDAEYKELNLSNVQLEGFSGKEVNELIPVLKSLLSSYMQKSSDVSLVDWLKDELIKHLPNELGETVATFSEDIVSGVDNFNNNMIDLESNRVQGNAKEAWLKNQLKEILSEMDINEQGKYLSQVEQALAIGNQVVNTATNSPNGGIIKVDENSIQTDTNNIPQNWNKYSLQEVINNITKQAQIAGVAGTTIPVGINTALQNTENETINQMPKEDILDSEIGSDFDRGIKTVAAGALKICVDKGKIPFISKDTPIGGIVNMACWGVETVKTLGNFAQGKMSALKVVDKLGNIAISAVAELCRTGATKVLSAFPTVGPVIGGAVGAAIGNMVSTKVKIVLHKGLEKIKPIAATVLDTARNAVAATVNTVKNIGNKVLSFFGF